MVSLPKWHPDGRETELLLHTSWAILLIDTILSPPVVRVVVRIFGGILAQMGGNITRTQKEGSARMNFR